MTQHREHVVILGGGLAGSALATLLARAGRPVTLFEKDTFPRDKLCGEFLSPEAQSLLERIGYLDPVLGMQPARVQHARFSAASGRQVELRLPGVALGISRKRLDAGLFAHAEASGVCTRAGMEVKRVQREGDGFVVEAAPKGGPVSAVRAAIVIGAQGRRSRVDNALDRPFMRERDAFVGLKRHHRLRDDGSVPELDGYVEVHAFDGGYCGLTRVEDGLINACMLLEQRFVAPLPRLEWNVVREHLIPSNRVLRDRFDALEPADDTVQAVAQVPLVDKSRSADGVLFVGDAAGMIAPLAGDGQAMALNTAVDLAGLVESVPARPDAPAIDDLCRRWDRLWRLRYSVRVKLGRSLQSMLLKPNPADRAIRLLNAVPGLGPLAVRLTRG